MSFCVPTYAVSALRWKSAILFDNKFECNERVMHDVEVVSQDSSGSGATLGEILHSLEVEIGSADGTGNLRQIDASRNMEGMQDGNSNREQAKLEITRESSKNVRAHTPSE